VSQPSAVRHLHYPPAAAAAAAAAADALPRQILNRRCANRLFYLFIYSFEIHS